MKLNPNDKRCVNFLYDLVDSINSIRMNKIDMLSKGEVIYLVIAWSNNLISSEELVNKVVNKKVSNK